jgi:Ca2+-binding RTX toxin-like protein
VFARLIGPSGNQILVFSGIGDPGVLAVARSLNMAEGMHQIDDAIESSAIDVTHGWEVLLEVDGHSRTDLDFRVLGLYSVGEHLLGRPEDGPGLSATR